MSELTSRGRNKLPAGKFDAKANKVLGKKLEKRVSDRNDKW